MTSHRIALCGDSLFIKAIEAALAEQPHLRVRRFKPCQAGLLSQITTFEPELVILAVDEVPSDLTLALLQQGWPLVQLGPQQAALLTRQPVSLLSVDDVARLLQKMS